MNRPTRTCTLAAATATVLATLTVPAAAANTTYHVDCSAGSNGTGSQSSPFNNLASASSLTLGAGDSVLFKRGVICLGQYTVQGAGSAAAGIVIGAYGTGTARPKINANGAANAVLLAAVSHVTVQDLELTAPGDNLSARRGLYAYAADAGTITGTTVRRLYIHDVRGKLPSAITPYYHGNGKFSDASGGIVVEAGGSTTATRYVDVDILDNDIRGVDRQGIYFWSNWCNDPALPQGFPGGACTKAWNPHDEITIEDNRLFDIGGDGVVPKTATDIMVQRNKVIGFNRRSGSPNIAFWSANTRHTVFQHNEAAGGKTTADGQGFDVDHSTDDTVFQYNYSHDNEGGFFLICPVTSNKNWVIRYNLSVDDKNRLFHICTGTVTNGQIYNNTMVVGNGMQPNVVLENSTANNLDIEFRNNIVSKEDSGTLGWTLSDPNFVIDNNAFKNVAAHPNATNTVTAAHGLIAPLNHVTQAYHLSSGSALHGAGVTVSGNGGLDYFGNAVPASGAPDIGAYEGAGTCAAALANHFDGDATGSAPSGWTTGGGIAVASRSVVDHPGGEWGKSVTLTRGTAEASMTRSYSASGNQRVSVRVRPDQTDAPLGVWLLDSAGAEVAKVTLASSGKFGYTNGGSWVETGTYFPGEWYRFDLVTDDGGNTYDFLVDGKLIADNAAMGPATGTPAQVKVRSQSGGSSVQTFGVDDVFVRNC